MTTTTLAHDLANSPEVAQLAQFFRDEAKKDNVLTMQQFAKFAILYREEGKSLSRAKITELTQEFYSLIDFYKPISIVRSDSDPTVVARLGNALTEFMTLPHTPENAIICATNTQMTKNPVEKYAAVAFNRFADAVLKAQIENADNIGADRERFTEIVEQLRQSPLVGAGQAEGAAAPAAVKAPEAPIQTDPDEWAFD